MTHSLLLAAGLSHNWGAQLAKAVSNDRSSSVEFLERFDAIFTLNQDLLFEIAYLLRFISLKWSAAEVPGMQALYEQGRPILDDPTKLPWRPASRLWGPQT